MSMVTLVKAGVHIMSALGVGKVLNDVVRNNTNVVNTADKILVNAGTLVLGSMIVEKAHSHVSETMSNMVTLGAQFKQQLDDRRAELDEFKQEKAAKEKEKEETPESK
jgi:hypothetical protein